MFAWANSRNIAPKSSLGSAFMFSLVQMAIEHGLNPYRCLTWLMKTAKGADLRCVPEPAALERIGGMPHEVNSNADSGFDLGVGIFICC